MYTTLEATRKLGINMPTFRYRAKAVGLVPGGSSKFFLWTDDQVDIIGNCKRKVSTNFFKYSKKKINIVDFYLTHRHNTAVEISKAMDINVSKVNATLNEFLDTGHIVVESRMNVNNFDKHNAH